MGWLARYRRKKRLREIRPLDLDAICGPLSAYRHPEEQPAKEPPAEPPLAETGNAGRHWNDPTRLLPNVGPDRPLMTPLAQERSGRREWL